MGSSPDQDLTPPEIQGPPVEQLHPAQPPPRYPEFIQGGGVQRGLTPEMLAAIAAQGAPASVLPQPPQAPTGATDPLGAASAPELLRQTLAEQLAGRRRSERPERGDRPGFGGRMGAGLY